MCIRDRYLANLGYIIVSIENRGANAPRGREGRKCIYGEVGTFASEDQARGIQYLARQYSFIDTARIGITCWSGGGSQTLNSICLLYTSAYLPTSRESAPSI